MLASVCVLISFAVIKSTSSMPSPALVAMAVTVGIVPDRSRLHGGRECAVHQRDQVDITLIICVFHVCGMMMKHDVCTVCE